MSKSRSVIICGGGIVGLCTAYTLARAGCAVTVIERNAAGADSCAHGSAGYISPSHVVPLSAPGMIWQGMKWMLSSRSPFYIKPRFNAELWRWSWLFARSCSVAHTRGAAPLLARMSLGSRQLFVEMGAAMNGAFDLQTEGLINLCKTAECLDHEAAGLAKIAREVGVEAQVLNPQQTAALEPGIRMEVAGCIYFPIDAHLTPRVFMPALLDQLAQLGVKFLWNTSINGWRTDGGRITAVSTTAGDLMADDYVLATGSWATETVRGLDLRLPMQPGKGYSLTIEQPRFQLKKSIILADRRAAVTPMGSKLRFGGTMELGGHDGRVRPERIQQIIDSAQWYFPDFRADDFAGIEPWFGYRPVSPDGLPYVGRFRKHPNLIAACGHAMLGLTLAPITGQLVGELVTGQSPSIDLTLLAPDRFA